MTKAGAQGTKSRRNRILAAFVVMIKAAVPLLILAAGAGAVVAMIKTAPEPKRATPERLARLVTVVEALRGRHPLRVEASGTVRPAREVTINPQVAGEIIEISPDLEPGGYFDAGDVLLKIDPDDYELAARMREAELTQRAAQYTLEEANRDVAIQEYEVLGEELTEDEKSLVLREPQLEAAAADVAVARAMLEDARLDLQRTTVTAPFDAQVADKFVERGTRVTTQTPILRLVGTDTYWIELSVQQSDLRWIDLPAGDIPGSTVTLKQPKVWGPGAYREGRVIRLLPDLTNQGSMARVLVAVDDPLCRKPENADKPKLLVGQYLTAEIEGAVVDDAVVLERRLLRDGDQVWIMNDDNKLEVRPVEIVYRGREQVLVGTGIRDGERIVSTDIATVADGMELRLGGADDAPETTKPPVSAEKGSDT